MKRVWLWLSVGFAFNLQAMPAEKVSETIYGSPNPFFYDLRMTVLPAAKTNADLLICMHGMGGDYQLAEVMRNNPAIPYHIVTFNFPDHGLHSGNMTKTSFGSIDELLPAFYVMKRCVLGCQAEKVHLYGFSAGGGAIVNAMAVLNSSKWDSDLEKFGIGSLEKQQILKAIQNGSVILEVPLKSFDEIADQFGDANYRNLAQRADKNDMVPLKNLKQLDGLSLNFFVYFANPDEALGNRDDKAFIGHLQNVNKLGKTVAIIGKTAGHTTYHPELWEAYKKFIQSSSR